VRLTRAGRIVAECWAELPLHLEGVSLDVFVVRPDHLHAIVHLQPIEPPRSLVTVIQAFKSAATKRLGAAVGRGRPPTSIWQRSFFDRVIRNDAELAALRGYVVDNPAALSARLGLWSEPDAPDL
jgi:REP element-mobilizing transposase RayT